MSPPLPALGTRLHSRRRPHVAARTVRTSLAATLTQLADETQDTHIFDRHLAKEERINRGHPLVTGNAVSLLQNGPETYAAMFDAIAAARDHVHLETYIFDDGAIGQRFADALAERSRAGVAIHVIYDSIGTLAVPAAFFESMRAAGIELLEFHPVNPARRNSRLLRVNNRDHRKLLVVDGRTVFVGGINISNTYSSAPALLHSGASEQSLDEAWRDTHVRIEGPAAAHFQRLFIDTWNSEAQQPLEGARYFPQVGACGSALVRAIASEYDDDRNQIFATLQSAIENAESSIELTVAYFAPDRPLLNALRRAAHRRVDVKMVLPSRSDAWPIFHLGRSYYGRLLRAGVKIYERQGPVMHSKTALVDGVWSTVGSANLDWRSMLHNNEANAVVLDRDFAQQMSAMFQQDLQASVQIDRRRWRRRSLVLRIKEFCSRLMAYFL